MASQSEDLSKEQDGPIIPYSEPAGGTAPIEVTQTEQQHPLRQFFKILGPGLITGASDDDPSGIGTYTAAGASLGFTMLWTALITFPMMAVVQYICAKVGMVSGRGFAGVLKRHFAAWILYPVVFALLLANIINAGADIGAIAAAINLLIPVPAVVFIIPITLVLLALQVWGSYRLIAQVFRWLTLALFAYIASIFFSHPDAIAIVKGTFIPTFTWDRTFLFTLVAILGTTISPYLFFWQSDQEVEEKICKGRVRLWQRRGATGQELSTAGWDVTIGMFLSNFVMYCIILATAATLFKAGKHDVQSATDAAQALRPLVGNAASIVLAVGLIGAGCLAVPVLTGSAAYALSEALGWKYGLDRKPRQAKQFYAIIGIAMLVGMLINFIGINPISALLWTAVINGVLAPPLLVLLMIVSNNRKIMGKHVNGFWLNLVGWVTTVVMSAAAIALFFTLG
jgi:NRAMP (natural resistance-associated macrophage protein)-like metal ion transporter